MLKEILFIKYNAAFPTKVVMTKVVIFTYLKICLVSGLLEYSGILIYNFYLICYDALVEGYKYIYIYL